MKIKEVYIKIILLKITAFGILCIVAPFWKLYSIAQIHGWDAEIDASILPFGFAMICCGFGIVITSFLVLASGAYKDWKITKHEVTP